MRVLVVGSGGREHALCWKIAQCPEVREVLALPGNPGLALEAKVECVPVAVGDFAGIHKICAGRKIELVVVGPDQALADGLVDYLAERGVLTFGPSRAAAQVEWSKAFAKEVMAAANIPTARHESFTDLEAALQFLQSVEWGRGWVVKADGLALGKGVVVAAHRAEAEAALREFLSGRAHGEAGRRVVVEERLEGREASVFFLCDGERAVPLGLACDYKRIFDGDQGPNTGGMGAFSPADWLPEGFTERVQREVAAPLLTELAARGTPFRGVLFVGLMVTQHGPMVIEFNARFGDPETQVLMPLLGEDLVPWLRAAAEGRLDRLPASGPRRRPLHGVHVVLAAEGYPAAPTKGDAITLPLELLPQENEEHRLVKVFFAGVARQGGQLLTNGGRVLGLTALAETRAEARRKAYELASTIVFRGSQRRGDIGG